jgi:hypothetical protein
MDLGERKATKTSVSQKYNQKKLSTCTKARTMLMSTIISMSKLSINQREALLKLRKSMTFSRKLEFSMKNNNSKK